MWIPEARDVRIVMDSGPLLPRPWRSNSDHFIPRDYYVLVAGNDYSVHPTAIGHIVEVSADLERVLVRQVRPRHDSGIRPARRAGRTRSSSLRSWTGKP